jgi:cytochrome c-type biogenesis protein CcsB
MKKFSDFIFSAGLMAVVLVIFAVSIAAATFIENDFGAVAARSLVYNAHWFEFLLLVGAVNLTGRIVIKKLYTRKKFSIFLFHAAFIIILAGSVITRYTGWEGTVSIREGQSTDFILTDKASLQIDSKKSDGSVFHTSYSQVKSNLRKTFRFQNQEYKIRVKDYVRNAYRTITPADNGTPMAELVYADQTGRKSIIAGITKTGIINDLEFSFEKDEHDSLAIFLSYMGDSLFFTAPFPVTLSGMGSEAFTILKNNEPHYFGPGTLYRFKDQTVVLNRFLPSAEIAVQQIPSPEVSFDAVVMEISGKKQKNDVIVMGKAGYPGVSETLNIDGIDFIISYGSVHRKMPFELKLNDFMVERYPGSKSPSSFESNVTLTDKSRNLSSQRRIYMNNILKYRGYRFYQSSYDPDEKGTILSVNHDLTGTSVTYTGYALMAAGMILSLFNRNSRFRQLTSGKQKRAEKIIATSVIMFLFALPTFAQQMEKSAVRQVDEKHAVAFSRMLIQSNDGRIEPASTLSSEILRKLLRNDSYKGMNADQVVLGMMSDPAVWQYEPLIRSSNSDVRKIMGSGEKYFSFASFFNDNSYILENYVNAALRKKPAERNKFDSEVLKLDEKINICYMIFTGELLRIFPVPGDSSHTWHNHESIKGQVLNEDSVFTSNVVNLYQQEIRSSIVSGNWANPTRILNAIAQYQQKYSAPIIPSDRKVSAEILLNKTDIFSKISRYYGIIGFVLLVLQFIAIFLRHINLKVPVVISIVLIIILFCLHTTGLITRWYVSGHAPLSNGYEALTYVAWAAVLAGLVFARRSPVTLSITSVLTSLILFVAHLSWMDPQITNLVPVLKSYWLVIHVATITASYAFLGMGALMAYMNLLIMALHNGKNRAYVSSTIDEFSDIIEMALTVGLYLLTIGVFLGAVWANESWGRYWGWDPKETWALVTVLVYAFILHMRVVPGLKGVFTFNLASLVGFSSVIMTYFGVNYYLSGLHSYAKGDPVPVPSFVYYAIAVVVITGVAAYLKKKNLAPAVAQ